MEPKAAAAASQVPNNFYKKFSYNNSILYIICIVQIVVALFRTAAGYVHVFAVRVRVPAVASGLLIAARFRSKIHRARVRSAGLVVSECRPTNSGPRNRYNQSGLILHFFLTSGPTTIRNVYVSSCRLARPRRRSLVFFRFDFVRVVNSASRRYFSGGCHRETKRANCRD